MPYKLQTYKSRIKADQIYNLNMHLIMSVSQSIQLQSSDQSASDHFCTSCYCQLSNFVYAD